MSRGESETRTRILAATLKLMEAQRGKGVRMSDIATTAEVSRQAVYLHFGSRAELLVATTHYVDEVEGLDDRLKAWRAATTGVEMLFAFIEFWGNYIPCIYSIGRALLEVRESDEAAAVAWNDRMAAVRDGCRSTLERLQQEGVLTQTWTFAEALDLLWTLLSLRNWELLTMECGWTTDQYIDAMQTTAKRTLLQEP